MSAEAQDRIREWHERAYAEMSRTETVEVIVLGVMLTVPPQVFAPPPMDPLLARAVQREVRPDDRVLDMGTGSGINAILAASEASHVVAVDINPGAVECARTNAKANGVADRIRFLESDVFDRVEGRFDLIVFDPPFRWYPPRDMLEAAITDTDYCALTRFMAEATDYLNDGGRILLSFGTSADLDYLQSLIKRYGFASQVVAQHTLVREDWTVDYYVFRMTSK
jgi:release factor glutamine methyltransferase